ncbi:MAG: Mur ligase family protein, partial [Pseudomonadota bacterium]|nr:Mur ligase family protein [Pseudomonadota bacterium]
MTQKHAILGFGVTGQSVARHLLANAKEYMVFDTRPSRLTPKEFEQLAIHWQIADWSKQQMADQLGTVDRVVVSPGIELDLPILEVAREMDLPIVSDIDLFFEATTAPVIGVTGTNGKSTVVSLVGHILNRAGKTCGVGGNIGHAALDLLGRPQSC